MLYRDDRMLDRIHRAHQWTVNPWNASEDTEKRLGLASGRVSGVSPLIKYKHHDNYNNILNDARADYKTDTLRIYLFQHATHSQCLMSRVWPGHWTREPRVSGGGGSPEHT